MEVNVALVAVTRLVGVGETGIEGCRFHLNVVDSLGCHGEEDSGGSALLKYLRLVIINK